MEGVIQTITVAYIFKNGSGLLDLLHDIMASKAAP